MANEINPSGQCEKGPMIMDIDISKNGLFDDGVVVKTSIILGRKP